MNNLEYLNSISAPARPAKPQSKGISGGLVLKLLAAAVVVLVAIFGLSAIQNNSTAKATDLARQLYLRMNNVSSLISRYNSSLKSSQLRSINYSLSGTLTGSIAQLGNYLNSTKGKNEKDISPSAAVATSEGLFINDSLATLDNAKLNGILDRYYVAQIHMQVSLLLALASELAARDHTPALNEILGSLHSNLTVIEEAITNYSTRAN